MSSIKKGERADDKLRLVAMRRAIETEMTGPTWGGGLIRLFISSISFSFHFVFFLSSYLSFFIYVE